MGYDWELIDRLNREAHARTRYYRCAFVEAIRGRSPHGHGPAHAFLDRALEILAFPGKPDHMIGEKIRGSVHKREAVDRPPPYHYKPVCLRANEAVGEFTARVVPICEPSEYLGSAGDR